MVFNLCENEIKGADNPSMRLTFQWDNGHKRLFIFYTAPGSANLGEPPSGEPDVTLTLSSRDLRCLLNEETTPFSAYMTGRLEVDGDTALASKLSELIDIVNK